MIIRYVPNGPFYVNSYLISDNDNNYIAIDPGNRSLSFYEKEITSPDCFLHILVTHAHIDHVGGIPDLKKIFPNSKVLMSKTAADSLHDLPFQSTFFGVSDPGPVHCDSIITAEKNIIIGSMNVRPIDTPGHCPGSLSFLIGDALFTGDTLFDGTIGITDIPGGNFTTLIRSITENLFLLPDETRVFPGHGGPTTIGHEKRTNPYIINSIR